MLRKLTRSQLRPLALRLYAEQGHLCPLCNGPIDQTVKGQMVVDHAHDTGRVRGALCRSCNSMEGKVFSAVGRWCVKKMDYALVIPALRRLADYLEKEPTNFIYPSFLTEEEKRLAKNAKERRTRATRQARLVVRKSVVKKSTSKE